MAINTYQAILHSIIKTKSDWNVIHTIIPDKQIVYAIDDSNPSSDPNKVNYIIKVGDGRKEFSQLPAISITSNLDQTIQNILNTLNNKVDKTTNIYKIYGTDGSGNQTLYDYYSMRNSQVLDMPEITEENDGRIVQYTGESTEDYINSYFYQAHYNEDTPEESYWERIDVQPVGKFLAMWDAETGLPETNLEKSPYTYNKGDFYLVGNVVEPIDSSATVSQTVGSNLSDITVNKETLESKLEELVNTTLTFVYSDSAWTLDSETVNITEYGISFEGTVEEGNTLEVVYTAGVYNYKPSGNQYVEGVASTTVETESISEFNTYMYTGSEWILQSSGKVDDVQLNGVSIVENKIANIEPTASDVAYTNDQYPSMHTLQDAMDRLLYITPSVSISGGGTYEIGATRATTTLTWSWNKTIVSQSLNQGIGDLDPTLRTYTYNTPITSNTTFTISGTDGTTPKSASTSITFSPKRYWGVSANTSLTDEQILSLSSELSTSRTQTRTFDCSGGKYFYFVIRTSYCNGISFKVNGLAFSDMDLETRNVVNAQGYTASYNIYRVHNIQTGSAIEVQVL